MSKTMYKVKIIFDNGRTSFIRFYTEKEARDYMTHPNAPKTKYIGKVKLGHYKNGEWQETR